MRAFFVAAIVAMALIIGTCTGQLASASDTLSLGKAETAGMRFVHPSDVESGRFENNQERHRDESRHQESPEAEQQKSEFGLDDEKKKMKEQIAELYLQSEKPQELKSYVAVGVVRLLFENVTEPFTLFYDSESDRSRVDYGSGIVRTIQLGKSNRAYRIEFPTHEAPSTRPTCVEMKGTKEKPVRAQRGIPHLERFEHSGSEQLGIIRVDRWKYEMVNDRKTTKHIFSLLTEPKTRKPMRLEVVATFLKTGQVIDRYEIDYKYFFVTKPSDDVFQVPSEVECRSIVGTLFEEASSDESSSVPIEEKGERKERRMNREEVDRERMHMNPIGSLIDPEEHMRVEKEVERLFEGYRRRYSKQYKSDEELDTRRAAFCHNFRYINLMNRAGLSYRLRVNHLADRTNDELRKMLGVRRTKIPVTAHGVPFDSSKHNLRGIDRTPSNIDWRLLGAVTPVANQRTCGSDWAIAATTVVESALFLRSNRLIKLSPQELIDCSHEEGNRDCEYGEDFRAYEYILKRGLASEMSYEPLLDRKGECRRDVPVSAKIKQWVLVRSNDEYELKRAVAMNGPVAVTLDAAHKSFFFYSSGIYKEPNCRNLPTDVNHAVVVVGYGQLNGRDYLLVQNSFSSDWGNSGYMLIDYNLNHCGILSTPTFALM